ncbi:MAG: hypothetical protein M3011_11325 [Actinomycetota bacterium]|nr:hypothetical protein [Actinomycetota bacterium]
MPFAAALSSHPVTAHATGEVIGQVIDGIGAHPDLAVLVASPGHMGALEDAAAAVRSVLAPTVLLGGVAGRVDTDAGLGAPTPPSQPALPSAAGPGGEAVGLWAAHTGPVVPVRLADLTSPSWAQMGRASFDTRALVVAGAAGATLPAASTSGLTVAGAVSDVAGAPIVLDGTAYGTGAVGVLLGPGVDLSVLVEQGHRPIGGPSTVTRTEGALLVSVDGRPAMSVLVGIARDQVPAGDIALINRSVHLEVTSAAGVGSRCSVRGRDGATGTLVIDPEVRLGDVVQFCIHDPEQTEVRARQVVGAAAGGALVWRTRRSDSGPGTSHKDGDDGMAGGCRPPRSVLACQAASLLGMSGQGQHPADPDTIGIGIFREPRVARP